MAKVAARAARRAGPATRLLNQIPVGVLVYKKFRIGVKVVARVRKFRWRSRAIAAPFVHHLSQSLLKKVILHSARLKFLLESSNRSLKLSHLRRDAISVDGAQFLLPPC